MGQHSIGPKHRAKRVTEDEDFLAMMWRMANALETRANSNPELLPQMLRLADRIGTEAVAVVIAENKARFDVDPRRGLSMAECARVLRITKQSGSERLRRGRAIMAARIDESAGATRLSRAAKDRSIIRDTARTAVVQLSDWLSRRAS